MQLKSSVFHNFCSRRTISLFSLVFFLLFFIPKAKGQESDVLESFSLVQNGNSVIANFSIKGGAKCSGVTLERRLDQDLSYEVAGGIQGVCGGSEFIEHYSIVDNSPKFSEVNIYRLILGNTGKSLEVSISVVELLDEYTIFPQPSAEEVFIKFNNPNNESVTLRVYDAQGRKIKERNGLTEDILFIDSSSFQSGLFIFQIEFTSSKLLSGRFIKSGS